MKQLVTTAIILGRTDYGEADRILTLLTPEHGKLRLLAKGVRRVKSKMAGGIELFSVSEITFIKGRGDIGTLVSTRLIKHYEQIVADLDRTMLGYDLIKKLNKNTEDEPEPEYFELLEQAFVALNDRQISRQIIIFWFGAQMLRLNGHTPNLQTDDRGQKLAADQTYDFNFEHMAFFLDERGRGGYTADHIKLLRLTFDGHPPRIIQQIKNVGDLLPPSDYIVQQLTHYVA
ncbi:MAG TPA: DNA repair protein RecO [Candidatus Saccharimonadales bacterium]